MHRILILELDIRLFATASLKDKRSVRKRLTDKLKANFNVSVAETSAQDMWQRLGLTISYVALDENTAGQMADTLRLACDRYLEGDGEIMTIERDIL